MSSLRASGARLWVDLYPYLHAVTVVALAIGSTAAAVGAFLLDALALKLAWGWIVVATFPAVPPISCASALGLWFLIGWAREHLDLHKDDRDLVSWRLMLITLYGRPLAVIAIIYAISRYI